MATPLKLEVIASATLFKLFRVAQSGDGYISPEDMSESFERNISEKQVRLAVEHLSERDLCSARTGPMGTKLQITRTGYLAVENDLDDPSSFSHQYSEKGNKWLWETGGRIKTIEQHDPAEIPASDRLVKLDHNSNEYQEATHHLDELIEAVGADRSNDFEDKDQRLAELKAGRELLNSNTASPTKIEAVLYGSLGYLATKFADEPIGALAAATWAAIKILLGL
ncbi:hypothetical protein [Parvibaculum sp.]|uniref:hypothetical protein n=1 Tax=Parvibaculum sp. TaxID=2024848 RepID=UPI001DEA4F60|nr:hypothetical protein [Parvibaculum sp.]MBX3488734.1 hypothetical protein [Parvibaculum sp.]MCW5727384.1 hypothetical protein [Parvibaculum sp.]